MKFGHSPEFCVCVCVCVCMREREREREREMSSHFTKQSWSIFILLHVIRYPQICS